MSSRVVGLDIGRLSVKAVTLELGLRTFEVVEVVEEAILPHASGTAAPPSIAEADTTTVPRSTDEDGETPPLGVPLTGAIDETDDLASDASPMSLGAPTLAALGRLAARGVFEVDAVFACLPDEGTFLTRVALPFATAREIRAVLLPQLEGRVPGEVDDLLFDFMRGGRLPSGEWAIYSTGIAPERLAIVLGELAPLGIDPRVVDIAPFPLMTVGHALLAGAMDEPIAIVDIGAESTGVVVFHGADLQYARTFAGGGERVTDALAAVFSLDTKTARDGKHREGFIDVALPSTTEPTGQDAVDIANACREASRGVVRQLRRTLHAHATEWGRSVSRVYLCGGGAALPGLADYVEQSLGVETRALPFDAPSVQTLPGFAEVGPRFATALGVALRAVPGVSGSSLNARMGPFSFRGSFEYVRARLPQMIAGAAVLLVLVLASVGGRVALLGAQSRALDSALADASESVFGEAITDADEIRRRFRLGSVRPAFLPEVSAFQLFVDISNALGGTVDLGYDVVATDIEVDMERRIFRLDGRADSAESVDTFEGQLDEHPCLSAISRTSLSQRPGVDGFEFALQGSAGCGAAPQEPRR